MTALIGTNTDWPILILAIVVAFFVFSWPAYRRLVRKVHIGLAEGDIARSLDACLALQASWLPQAVLARRRAPGMMELNIATWYTNLGDPEHALVWAQKSLQQARRSDIRAQAHSAAALVCADLHDLAGFESHLTEKRKHPAVKGTRVCNTVDVTVIGYLQLGEVERALAVAMDLIADRSNRQHGLPFTHLVLTLYIAGRFDEIFALMSHAIRDLQPAALASETRHPHALETSTGLDQARKAYQQIFEVTNLLIVLDAARHARRWDIYEHFVDLLAELQEKSSLRNRAHILGRRIFWAAHQGDRALMDGWILEMEAITEGYPRDMKLRVDVYELAAIACQHAGLHERALLAIQSIPKATISALNRSEHAAIAADSLEALGQIEAAKAKREQAQQLAPSACWNQKSGILELTNDPRELLHRWCDGERTDQEPGIAPVPESFRVGPIAPLVSKTACACWPLAILAMIPMLGSIAGIVLGILSIMLLTKGKPLSHDRRIGWAGLTFATLSIGIAILVITTNLLRFIHSRDAIDDAMAIDAPSEPTMLASNSNSLETEPALVANPTDNDSEEALIKIPWTAQLLFLVVLVVSIVFHEVGHAMAALWSGDPTARDQGRISLNPRRHIDWIGSVLVPLVLIMLPGGTVIGWAKPVPIRRDLFRNPRRGLLGVTLAGVSINFLIALVATNILAVVLILMMWLYPDATWSNIFHPLFPPVFEHVSHAAAWTTVISACKALVWINALLMCFNLLPVPPLDGFGVLQAIAPSFCAPLLMKLSGLGMILLFVLIAFNLLIYVLIPAVYLTTFLLLAAQLCAGVF